MGDFLQPEVGAEAPIEDVGLGAEPGLEVEGPLGSKLTLTADDIPELSDLQPGDTISFTVDDITEDGNYALTVAPAEIDEPLPEELPAEEPVPGGQAAVLDQLGAL